MSGLLAVGQAVPVEVGGCQPGGGHRVELRAELGLGLFRPSLCEQLGQPVGGEERAPAVQE